MAKRGLHYSMVTISDLNTTAELYDALERIEIDGRNYTPGTCMLFPEHLLVSAEKKVDAIENKITRIHDRDFKALGTDAFREKYGVSYEEIYGLLED